MQRTGRPWAWALRRVRGEGPELLPLSGPAVVLGTAPDCDAVLSAKGVSRHHARLTVAEEGVRVEDLGSKNGTYCHGQRLEGAQLLVAGEEVAFGPAVYVLELVPAGETRVALPLGWPGTDGLPDGDTDSGDEGKVPTKYLELLGEVVPLLGAAPGALTTLCQRLKVTAGVKGVALARGRAGEALEVLAAAGSCPSLAPVGEHLACLAWAGNLTAGQAQVLEVEQMHGAVVSAPAGGWLALVATGDGDGDVAPVLKVLIGLLARKLLTFKGEDIPEGPHPVDELIFPEGHVVLTSKAMEEVYARIRQVARSDFPVLFQGETGVGKEHMVTILHLSSRRSGALVAVNCAAIPGDLLEAELFGIEKGVATGVWAREGKFQQAHGGTLFLDEVGEMPPALQPKLLRVLQAGEVVPVGAKKPVRVDVRVVAATNCCLAEKVEQGSFRGDLYYRLAGMVIEVPPLRQLPEDIPSLVSHFLHREAKRLGKPVRGMSERALEALVAYHWPGNIRQLEYEVRRLVTACPAGGLVTSEMLSPEVRKPSKGQEEAAGTLALPQRVAALERQLIAEALRRTGGNLAAAARLLGISRYGLVLKAKRLGILADARKANQL